MSEVKIRGTGIKKALSSFNCEEAISEYIWNGFDAGASVIELNTITDPLENVLEFSISDNGKGIDFEQLENKFIPFLESEKSVKTKEENISLQGKNGYGRLTFFKFAQYAIWKTFYKKDEKVFTYDININAESLNKYDNTQPIISNGNAGTVVSFKGILPDLHKKYVESKLTVFLRNEFAWFLELNSAKSYKILINNVELIYKDLILDKEKFLLDINDNGQIKDELKFDCEYIHWKGKLNDEFSRFYFINKENKLKNQRTTKLNKKGDQFYHSIIIKSNFFENFNYVETEEETSQMKMFSANDEYKVFRTLLENLNNYLKKKRKPFLHQYAKVLIENYEKEDVMPKFGDNTWDKVRKEEFVTLVKELYEVEPGLFVKLNTEQKKTFLHLLNLLLDSNERESLFSILEGIVELDPQDRKDLEKILKTTRLNHVIKALKLVQDRILVLEKLKELALNHQLKANEKDHLQSVVQEHYWIFGEQYNLVCAAEAKFEKALRNHIYLLRGEDQSIKINHEHKNKEMDIFLVRQNFCTDYINNVVVELKNPTTIKKLTQKEFNQVQDYLNVILKTDVFNASNFTWDFYLIGQDYDDYVRNQIENAKGHGEKNLAFKVNNYKIFVKKWSEIFNEVEIRLRWLNDKLKIEREKLSPTSNSVRDIMNDIMNNSAKGTTEPSLPKRKKVKS